MNQKKIAATVFLALALILIFLIAGREEVQQMGSATKIVIPAQTKEVRDAANRRRGFEANPEIEFVNKGIIIRGVRVIGVSRLQHDIFQVSFFFNEKTESNITASELLEAFRSNQVRYELTESSGFIFYKKGYSPRFITKAQLADITTDLTIEFERCPVFWTEHRAVNNYERLQGRRHASDARIKIDNEIDLLVSKILLSKLRSPIPEEELSVDFRFGYVGKEQRFFLRKESLKRISEGKPLSFLTRCSVQLVLGHEIGFFASVFETVSPNDRKSIHIKIPGHSSIVTFAVVGLGSNSVKLRLQLKNTRTGNSVSLRFDGNGVVSSSKMTKGSYEATITADSFDATTFIYHREQLQVVPSEQSSYTFNLSNHSQININSGVERFTNAVCLHRAGGKIAHHGPYLLGRGKEYSIFTNQDLGDTELVLFSEAGLATAKGACQLQKLVTYTPRLLLRKLIQVEEQIKSVYVYIEARLVTVLHFASDNSFEKYNNYRLGDGAYFIMADTGSNSLAGSQPPLVYRIEVVNGRPLTQFLKLNWTQVKITAYDERVRVGVYADFLDGSKSRLFQKAKLDHVWSCKEFPVFVKNESKKAASFIKVDSTAVDLKRD